MKFFLDADKGLLVKIVKDLSIICIRSNYRLDFIRYSKFWGGPTETIVPTANGQVWGVVWLVPISDMLTLDKQMEVERNVYYIKQVSIHTPHIGDLKCRVYIQDRGVFIPLPRGDNDDIPVERWPSWSYKEIIITGAVEHNLPEYYIKYLENIKHNGDRGHFDIDRLLTRYRYARDKCQCKYTTYISRKLFKLDVKKLREKDQSTNNYLI